MLTNTNAKANLSLGISTMYFNNCLHYEGNKFRPSFVVGWVENFDKNIVGVYTTRLNKSQKRVLENGLEVKSKAKSDIVKVGRRFDRFIYSGFITNTSVKTSIMAQSKKENFIGYGFSADYLLTRNISTGFGAIMPNKLGHGAYVNLSYNF
jgi:hypothetical protein